ncbi:helix-turn-helix domain-containing protein [Bacillus fonticola]|uniref:helix-turn-helix domain-containing protein n=1 Tax=Bacillus fonticola TaxID=2728853 RepID=UPI0014731356|nr:helix-turn-helix transcriptional regulator [Bacillus fonticola]
MEAEKWGRKIRAYRKLKGYTQEGLAKSIDISVSILGEVERGNRMPSQILVEKVAEELQIDKKLLTPEE